MTIKIFMPAPYQCCEPINSSFLFKSTRDMRYSTARLHLQRRRMNNFGEFELTIPRPEINNRRTKKGYDPILESLKNKVSAVFMSPQRGYSEYDDDWLSYFSWKYNGETVTVLLSKTNGLFALNNVRKNKEDCASALSKIILYGTTNRDGDRLREYIRKNVNYSQNILYALENRTPFWFFKDGSKIECRINMQLVDEDEIALEISDGIWGSMKVKDANIFINSYRTNSTRSKKWSNLSPRKLWIAVMKKEPSESELNLMIAWLMQNRTSTMVENRAMVLLQEITDKYDDMFLLNATSATKYLGIKASDNYQYAVLVRGNLGDWIIYKNDNNSRYQRVSAVFVKGHKKFDGPFCIDNMHDNSSIGDQIASRAMILKNDEQAKTMIHTLARVEKTNYRVNEQDIRLAGC